MEQRNKISSKWLLLASVAGFAGLLAAANPAAAIPAGWTLVGNGGNLGPNGVVTAPPQFGPNYDYITTSGGLAGVGRLAAGGTNGSLLTSTSFSLAVGDKLSFFFNYVTSDGAGFADYAWTGLNNLTAATTEILFSARTTPSGNTVPGFGLPGLSPNATLNPASTPIIAGGPSWSPLGGSSGACFAAGCGYTGWIQLSYTAQTAGTYQLQFGVTNFVDTIFDSGLALAGTTINDVPITGVPVPMSLALFGVGLLGLGAAARRRA